MAKIRTIEFKTDDALSSKRASAEIGSSQFEYKSCTLKDATIKVIMKQNYNGKTRQKTYYFKRK
jgi:hypothetical protein